MKSQLTESSILRHSCLRHNADKSNRGQQKTTSDQTKRAAEIIRNAKNITVFTGAGISVESGIPPFRGEGGLCRITSYNVCYTKLLRDWIFNNTDIKVLYALTNNKDESEPIHSKHGFSKNQFATNEGTWYCIEPCSNNHS